MLEEINNNFSWPLLSGSIYFFFMNFYIINQRLLVHVLYFGGNQIENYFIGSSKSICFQKKPFSY